jgi:phosphoribosylglycinamide formyltransferase-1
MEEKRIAVFASGRGSNFQAIIKSIESGYIAAKVALCVTNNPNAGVIELAEKYNIPSQVYLPKNFADMRQFNDAILASLIEKSVDYIVLAGYLKLIGSQIIAHYNNRILNVHPALLPSFGGKGMYGHHVHEAVFNRGCKVSGVTVHLVNTEFDEGPIVLQECVDISDTNSPEEIAAKVLRVEHTVYSKAVKLLVENKLKILGNRVVIIGDQSA